MGAGHCPGTSPSATKFPLPAAGFRRVYAAVVAGLSNAVFPRGYGAWILAPYRSTGQAFDRENDEMGGENDEVGQAGRPACGWGQAEATGVSSSTTGC